MTTLAVDLGTKFGFAIGGPGGSVDSGSIDLKPKPYHSRGKRFADFRRWLNTLPDGVTEVVFEDVHGHAATYAAQAYGGFEATLLVWCEQREIPYRGIHTGTLKKSIAGKGNAVKADMIAAVRRHGFNPADDNEADAIGLLLLALGRVKLAPPSTTTARKTPARKEQHMVQRSILGA